MHHHLNNSSYIYILDSSELLLLNHLVSETVRKQKNILS